MADSVSMTRNDVTRPIPYTVVLADLAAYNARCMPSHTQPAAASPSVASVAVTQRLPRF